MSSYEEYIDGMIYPYYIINNKIVYEFINKSDKRDILLYSLKSNYNNKNAKYVFIVPKVFIGVQTKKEFKNGRIKTMIYKSDFDYVIENKSYPEAIALLYELDDEKNTIKKDTIEIWRNIYENGRKTWLSEEKFAHCKVNFYKYNLPPLKRININKGEFYCPECLGYRVIPIYYGIGYLHDGGCYLCKGTGKLQLIKKIHYDFNSNRTLAMLSIVQYDIKYDNYVLSYINSDECTHISHLNSFLVKNELPLLERWVYFYLGRKNVLETLYEEKNEELLAKLKEQLIWWKIYYNEHDNFNNIKILKEKIINNKETPTDEKIFNLFVKEGYAYIDINKESNAFDEYLDNNEYDDEYDEDHDDDCNSSNSDIYNNWSNYNDDLDMDQQSEEFWDQF